MEKDYLTLDEVTTALGQGCLATLGFFDGVHRGHHQIFQKVRSYQASLQLPTLAITFEPHPRVVLEKRAFPLLTPLRVRVRLLKQAGMEQVLVLGFSDTFSQQTPEAFFRDILVGRLKVQVLVLGYNAHFGKNRSGTPEVAQTLGRTHQVTVEVCPPELDEAGQVIHSTRIREAVLQAHFKEARTLLGYDFGVFGVHVHGRGRGRNLGISTINVAYEDDQLLPPVGVYAVRLEVAGQPGYLGIANLGFRPTFEAAALDSAGKTQPVLEVHVIDPRFQSSVLSAEAGIQFQLVGYEVKVVFLSRVREEKKFAAPEELVRQIERDKEYVLTHFRRLKD